MAHWCISRINFDASGRTCTPMIWGAIIAIIADEKAYSHKVSTWLVKVVDFFFWFIEQCISFLLIKFQFLITVWIPDVFQIRTSDLGEVVFVELEYLSRPKTRRRAPDNRLILETSFSPDSLSLYFCWRRLLSKTIESRQISGLKGWVRREKPSAIQRQKFWKVAVFQEI